MASFYDTLKYVIQTVADGLGGVQKMMLGTPGDQMIYPTEPEYLRRTQDTGQAWDGFYMPLVLGGLGSLLDQFRLAWAWVDTKGTGVNPVLSGGYGFSGTVIKSEVNDTIGLTFDPAYTGYLVPIARVVGQHYIEEITSVSTGSVTFRFFDDAGVLCDINSREVIVVCVGNAG